MHSGVGVELEQGGVGVKLGTGWGRDGAGCGMKLMQGGGGEVITRWEIQPFD